MNTVTLSTQGVFEEINGIKTCVVSPKVDYPKDKVVLYLTDILGLEFPNNRVCCPTPSSQINLVIPIQLLAGDFARNGYKIYAPDLFEGDPVMPNAFGAVCYRRFEFVILLCITQRAHKSPFLGKL